MNDESNAEKRPCWPPLLPRRRPRSPRYETQK